MTLHRALLHLYPASFRAEYGSELAAIFARRRHEAAGPGAVAALWVETLADTVASAGRVHADLLAEDLRDTVRALRHAPGFTLTAVLVSALGIGATTAAFSVADHVLVRPLPFPDANRLVRVWQDQSFRGYSRMELSPPNYQDYKRQNTSFDDMAAYTGMSANLVDKGEALRLDGTFATGNLFRVLGVQAALGRTLTDIDDRLDMPTTLVLSHATWISRYGADPTIVGRSVSLNDTPHTIVGVMPAGFAFPSRTTAFWAPLRLAADDAADRTNWFLSSVARRKPDVSIEQARAELGVVAAQLAQQYPAENGRNGATVRPLRDEVTQQARLLLFALVGASICMLLISCTNLASLLMTRALARQKELAVRVALGAGWQRLLRQLLTESLLLSVAGGVAGVALAMATVPLVARLVPTALPIGEVPATDVRMLAIAAIVTLVTGMGFGMLPAIRMSRATVADGLRDGSRAGTGRRTERMKAALVVAEIAASVVLLVSAGLLIRALLQVQRIDPGFRAQGVLTLRTALPTPKYTLTASKDQFYARVVADIRALPGVVDAAYTSFLPMVMRGGIWPVTVDSRPEDPNGNDTASLRFVTPGFFNALSVSLVRGRDVAVADTGTAPLVAVVSQSFVDHHWPEQDPLGRSMNIGLQDRTVVGVVANVLVRGLERDSEPQVYLPSGQIPDGGLAGYAPKDLAIRAVVPPASLIPAIRQIVARVDDQVPVSDIRLLTDIVEAETGPRLVQVRVLGAFAAVAALLAAIGIHGLLAFSVSTRRREIGVRMALGAERHQILARFLGQGLRLATIGVVCGGVLAVAAGRLMQALLAGVNPADTTTLALAIGLVALLTVAGSLAPALRATRVDPITAIRTE